VDDVAPSAFDSPAHVPDKQARRRRKVDRGVATVWNPKPVKRFRGRAYNGSMWWVKAGFEVALA